MPRISKGEQRVLAAWAAFTDQHEDFFAERADALAELDHAARRRLPWSEVPWPTKAVAAFRDAGLATVGDVVAAGPRFFLDRKACGRVTLVLVSMVLETIGEELGVA